MRVFQAKRSSGLIHHVGEGFFIADACPKVIKEILFRAPMSEFINMKKVGAGFGVADNEIVFIALNPLLTPIVFTIGVRGAARAVPLKVSA